MVCASSNDSVSGGNDAGYSTLDAAVFAADGADAIKHDKFVNMPNSTDTIVTNYRRFEQLGGGLNATGRPVMYAIMLQVAHLCTVPSSADYMYGYLLVARGVWAASGGGVRQWW
jgi:hypothetical protein